MSLSTSVYTCIYITLKFDMVSLNGIDIKTTSNIINENEHKIN